jgi:ferredoxin/flavodoxin---NADP+ reductase
MRHPGTASDPLRVAVIGSGPAGFYVVQHLFRAGGPTVEVDMFERLAAPFGLVRFGVAPDHPKIKSVISVYEELAADPRFRLYANVDYGRDLSLADLRAHYHQIVFCTGAQSDRRLNVPGEDLAGSHPATEFVAWYNGHPDFAHLTFDLSCPRAVVVGVGNVAIDVARILCRTPEELARTDIAAHALAALRESRVREVSLLGRRGPLQAAFTNPEVKELGEMVDAAACTLPAEVTLDALSQKELERTQDRAETRKVQILQSYSGAGAAGKSRRLTIRFLVSPVEILGDARGHVRGVRLVHNELQADARGELKARATERQETLEAGLVLRSVGYHGVRLPDLPFDERAGVIPNAAGRVAPGVYVAGWIKRGPTGVIGTNKADAGETVRGMLEDLERGAVLDPREPGRQALQSLLASRGVRPVSYDDWRRIDALELARGAAAGRPRLKLVRHEEFLEALGGASGYVHPRMGDPGGPR